MKRRTSLTAVVASVLAVALLGTSCADTGSEGSAAAPAFSVGRQPYAAGNSPITQYMMDNNLVEKAAKELGVEVAINFEDYPSAAPQVQAMIGGRLDFGMWGNTPIIQAIAKNQPLSVISVGEGNLRFLLLTEKDSGIHNMEDLKGKTVGLLVGGDPHLAFLGMLQHELGVTDPAEAGINLVNLPTQAIAAKVPKGVHATVVGYPAVLKQMETDDSIIGIINSHGVTEAGYIGDAGTGAGIELPAAEESVFAPEGFYGHRSFWVVRNEVIEKHPKVVQAFLTAEQQALTALLEQDPKTVAESVNKYWDLSAESGAKILDDEILFNRGWIWPTEGDAQLLKKLSDLMAKSGVTQSPLNRTEIVDAFRKPADLSMAAYKATGSQPPESGFAATERDARGAPVWKLDTWSAPK